MRCTAGVVAAAILTFASLAHAQVTPAKDFRLVWLINDRAGKPLGVFAFPEHMALAGCAARAINESRGIRPPFEQRVGNYIALKLGKPLDPARPVCLTDAELAALVDAVKNQIDSPPGGSV